MEVPITGFWRWCIALDVKKPAGCPIWVHRAPFYTDRSINGQRYTTAKARRQTAEQLAASPKAYLRPYISFDEK